MRASSSNCTVTVAPVAPAANASVPVASTKSTPGVAVPAAVFAGLFFGVFPALVVDWWTHDRSGDDVDPDGPNALPTEDEEFSLVE